MGGAAEGTIRNLAWHKTWSWSKGSGLWIGVAGAVIAAPVTVIVRVVSHAAKKVGQQESLWHKVRDSLPPAVIVAAIVALILFGLAYIWHWIAIPRADSRELAALRKLERDKCPMFTLLNWEAVTLKGTELDVPWSEDAGVTLLVRSLNGETRKTNRCVVTQEDGTTYEFDETREHNVFSARSSRNVLTMLQAAEVHACPFPSEEYFPGSPATLRLGSYCVEWFTIEAMRETLLARYRFEWDGKAVRTC